MPLVSVVTPFYNEAEHLKEMIDSLLAQTFQDFDVIFVDDASTDGGLAVVEGYNDKRFHLIRNEGNKGNPASRNIGMRACSGKYIAVLDADDIARPDRLQKQVSFMEDNPGIDASGGYIEDFFADGRRAVSVRETDVDNVAVESLFQIPIAHTTCVVRRCLFDNDSFCYDEEKESGCDCKDYDLFCRMIVAGKKLANIAEILVDKRVHSKSVSALSYNKNARGNLRARRHLFARLGLNEPAFQERHHLLCDWLEVPHRLARPEMNMDEWRETLQAANMKTGLFSSRALEKQLAKVCDAFVCSRT